MPGFSAPKFFTHFISSTISKMFVMKKFTTVLMAILLTSGILMAQKSLTSFVNPFIGTGGHGHTYPGATMPFGMVQLSPDTRLEGWDGCGGYPR